MKNKNRPSEGSIFLLLFFAIFCGQNFAIFCGQKMGFLPSLDTIGL